MANKTISELNTATLSDSLVMVVEGATATEKTTVASLKEYIQEGVSIGVDSALSATSENPVQNKVITTALNNKVDSSSLASVATSGAYSDLTGTPTIPAAQIQSDWNQTDDSALDYIKNKPNIPEGVVADQTYNPASTNAQSGVAIAGAGFLNNTATGTGSIAIGEDAQATGTASTSLGKSTRAAGDNSIAIGKSARANGIGSIALGAQAKNLEDFTFKVALTDGNDNQPALDEASGLYTMLDSSGKIPDARLNSTIARVSQIPTLPTVDQTYDGTSSNAQSGVAVAEAISGKQDVSNLVTSLSASSTDTQYPSAKCVYDMIGDIEAVLATI